MLPSVIDSRDFFVMMIMMQELFCLPRGRERERINKKLEVHHLRDMFLFLHFVFHYDLQRRREKSGAGLKDS